MAKYVNPAEQFLRDLVAAYQAQLRRDAWDFWLERLKRWQLTAEAWKRALDLVIAGEQAMPALAAVYDYLRRAESEIRGPRDTKLQLFDGPDGRRYVRAKVIGKHEDGRDKLAVRRFAGGEEIPDAPAGCTHEHILVERPLDVKTDYENNPGAYPEYDANGKLTERGRQEVEEIKQQAIAQHVNQDLDAYGAKLIVLTGGHRGSMRKRDLDPLERQAREWAETASEQEIADARLQAAQILEAKFAGATALDSLVAAVASEKAPADYDDSEIALGKQRLAQLQRLEASERERARIADVYPGAQAPADAWREF